MNQYPGDEELELNQYPGDEELELNQYPGKEELELNQYPGEEELDHKYIYVFLYKPFIRLSLHLFGNAHYNFPKKLYLSNRKNVSG